MLTSTMSFHPFPMRPSHSEDADSDAESESDRYTDMSLDGFAPSATSSKTSMDVSMRSQSPAPSVFSVTSSLRAQAYRQEYGRGLNNYSEVYRLPADDEELYRLGMKSPPSFFPLFQHTAQTGSMKCFANALANIRHHCLK
jgi:hypothetical protein